MYLLILALTFLTVNGETVELEPKGLSEVVSWLLDNSRDVEFKIWNTNIDYGRSYVSFHVGDDPRYLRLNTNTHVKILIHGWFGNGEEENFIKMKNTYLAEYPGYNIVQVNWSRLSMMLYIMSAQATEDVGNIVGSFVWNLHHDLGIPVENIHLIGFSLGAHVAGFAGRNFAERTGHQAKVGRITGLDPAGPYFYNWILLITGLNKNDATFVDVIHTDGRGLEIFYPGSMHTMGHIDFYPNGATAPQPGCEEAALPICSHGKARDLYLQSLSNGVKFVAHKCPDSFHRKRRTPEKEWNQCRGEEAIMGENVDHSQTGIFYLETK